MLSLLTVYAASFSNDPATIGDLEVVFENIVSVLLGLGGLVFFIMIVLGGIKYLTAGNDPKSVEGARKTLTYAIAGIVFVAVSFLILRFIEVFTGVNVTEFSITRP